jgi:hypothetical protein
MRRAPKVLSVASGPLPRFLDFVTATLMNKLLLFAFLAVFSLTAAAGQKAPLPTKLKSAKTLLLVNEGVSAKLFDKVYAELKKWNRFQLVEGKQDADVVMALSRGSMSGAIAGSKGSIFGIAAADFSVRITDARDDTPLWADAIDGGHSTWYAGDSIVSHLRKRMDSN